MKQTVFDAFVAGWCALGARLQEDHLDGGEDPVTAQQHALATLVNHAVGRFPQTGGGLAVTPVHPELAAFLDRFQYRRGSDPADTITPEQLSQACEALLGGGSQDSLRHRAGIHYTSADEVDLLCRLTLATFLARALAPDPATAVLLHQLVLQREADRTTDQALLERGLWPVVLERLETLTVLDPCCGTGAFLVGMVERLEALVCRGQLALGVVQDPAAQAQHRSGLFRRLLGVDLMPWALAVARLRLRARLDLPDPPQGTLVAGDAAVDPLDRFFPQCFSRAPGERGVDLLLGNPPYVRQETLGTNQVKQGLRTRLMRSRPGFFARWPLDGRSDLYLYLILLGFDLLRPGGTLGLVTSGAWLDAGYGEPLRAFLRESAETAWIIDSAAERSFGAAVNTVLLVAGARRAATAAGRAQDRMEPPSEPTRFVTLRLPLASLSRDPAATFVPLLTGERLVQTPTCRALAVDLGEAPGASASLGSGTRWGGPYLRAPTLWERLRDCAHPLVALDRTQVFRLSRGRRTGADRFFYLTAERAAADGIEARFLRPLVKSPSEFFDIAPRTSALAPRHHLLVCDLAPEALVDTGAGRYLSDPASFGHRPHRPAIAGRPWYQLPPLPCGQLLLPIAVHERFLVIENDAGYEPHQRFAVLVFAKRFVSGLVPVVAACLSSIVVVLQLEALGRRSLGHGVLDVPPEDWRAVLLPEPTTLGPAARDALTRAWAALSAKPPQTLAQAAVCPVQRQLDALVLDVLGWPAGLGDALYEEALALLQTRLRKARRR